MTNFINFLIASKEVLCNILPYTSANMYNSDGTSNETIENVYQVLMNVLAFWNVTHTNLQFSCLCYLKQFIAINFF